ncbi:UNVERIFIED_CONTAM: AMP-binding protein, partial [Ralstonia mannitolilytica]
MMKQEFLLKLTPYQEAFYNKWKTNSLEGDPHIIIDQTFSGTIDIEKLNKSLIRFVNDNILVNSNILLLEDELFWKSRTLLHGATSLLTFLPIGVGPEELLKLILKPFDLENDHLVRFFIMRHNDNEHRIIFVFSSIIIDRLTDNFLCNELGKYYNDESYVNPVSLSEQMHLFNVMNNEIRSILNNRKDLISEFWKTQLAHIENPGFRFLETVYNKSVNQSGSLDILKFEFSEEILSKAKLLTEAYNLTPYAYGQMILAILLHRISGVNNLVIGYPVSIKKQQHNILGSHVNITAKAYYFSSDTRLKDLINQNADYLNNLWNTKADYLPVSDLIKHAPRPDMLELIFSESNFNNLFIDYDGITNIKVNDELGRSIFGPISIEQEIKNGMLHYKVLFDTCVIDSRLVVNFVELYKNLFVCILDDLLNSKTHRLISGYHLLNYEMYHEMIYSQNNTTKYYDREITLHGLFEEQALWGPDLTALVYGDIRLSYRDLNEKSNQLAHYLIQRYDIRPDNLIPICFNRSEKMLIGILGVLKAGGAYVPVDPGYPLERLGHILNDTGSRLVLGEEDTVTKLYEYVSEAGGDRPIILNLDDWDTADGIQRYSRDNPITEVKSNHLAYVIYTSGTTGKPKGVMIEHSGVVNLVNFMRRSHHFEEYTNVGCYSNYVFDAFVNEVFPVL